MNWTRSTFRRLPVVDDFVVEARSTHIASPLPGRPTDVDSCLRDSDMMMHDENASKAGNDPASIGDRDNIHLEEIGSGMSGAVHLVEPLSNPQMLTD